MTIAVVALAVLAVAVNVALVATMREHRRAVAALLAMAKQPQAARILADPKPRPKPDPDDERPAPLIGA